MKVFLLGATGRTGRLITAQALLRGHSVTVLVRTRESLKPHERLRVVEGSPLSEDDLSSLLPGQDVVISCLGQRSRKDATLLKEAARAMLTAMSQSGVRRYLVVSQGLLFPSRNPMIALLRPILRRFVADSAAMERLLRASDADWTIVRPPRLVEGGALRGYRTAAGARPLGVSWMQRADLAAFLLDEAERGEHVKAIVGVTSP